MKLANESHKPPLKGTISTHTLFPQVQAVSFHTAPPFNLSVTSFILIKKLGQHSRVLKSPSIFSDGFPADRKVQ